MKKLHIKNIFYVLSLVVVPHVLYYLADKMMFFLKFDDLVRTISNYTLVILSMFAGVLIVRQSYKVTNIFCRLSWIVTGVVILVYGLIMGLLLYLFRNGVGL